MLDLKFDPLSPDLVAIITDATQEDYFALMRHMLMNTAEHYNNMENREAFGLFYNKVLELLDETIEVF